LPRFAGTLVLFNSQAFILGFLPVALGGFFLLGRIGPRCALGWIAVASLFFYAWWKPSLVLLLLGSISGNYVVGQRTLALARAGRRLPARAWLAGGIVANLSLLGWWKYAGFIAGNIAWATGSKVPELHIFLPLAISFFTFQQIMFLIDSVRQDRPDAGWLPYLTFIAFFPHLIAGPIVRPREIIPQLIEPGFASARMRSVAEGGTIFLLGLAKKMVLADMFARFSDVGFDAAAQGATLTFFEAWYAAAAY
jgi:D-alanyl-lipoteichoic acid acyltransferase DltB (MBOAT superfamily)